MKLPSLKYVLEILVDNVIGAFFTILILTACAIVLLVIIRAINKHKDSGAKRGRSNDLRR